MTWSEIRDSAELTELFGEPTFRAAHKVRARLHPYDVDWLAASLFCVVVTTDETGRCDASPKGGRPGKVAYVIDDRTIALAERPGNRRMDGFRNILRNPFVGTNFFIPGRGDTLRSTVARA